ncbi:glycosyltransferase family 9 protein [Frankia sp. QA3]|uniref:glycosyltransferase family 9 protein n=1 Tax=Frankia sp. QA3 TaxID=710111 RepID=UPI000269BF2F|nr:glycosyltransferase family 9 protein [Frankia sp. QA3]EIV91504.1 ADP-heptose:LPS heptosyltransferase [Frankia sp. QA3]
MSGRVLVARLDSDGDVLLSGPAVRAVAARAARVTLLVGPRGRAAAGLLPGVDEVLVWRCPWIDPTPPPVRRDDVDGLVDRLAAGRHDEALILTSFHQSPLPLALVLRMAGVGRIAAAAEDYPGTLLDVRHRLPERGLHEVARALSTAAALGYPLPAGDDGMLAIRRPLPDPTPLVGAVPPGARPYVVLHPGASVAARRWHAAGFAALARHLTGRGHRVVVTGAADETPLTAAVAGRLPGVRDLGGRTDLAALAGVLDRAGAVVVGNTGPAHLAAAVATPVVSLFAPTVPAERWQPHTPRRVLLGDQDIGCAGCRAWDCPVPGHPCLSRVEPGEVVAAVETLLATATAPAGPAVAAGPTSPEALEASR